MTAHDTRRYEMLMRVREFGDTHREPFPESSVGGQAFAAVAAAVNQLKDYSARKVSAGREGKGTKKQARTALIDQLDAISRTARVIAEESPGFDDTFRLPKRPTDQALLTTGRVFVHDAEACTDQFVSHGLSSAFAADLHELVNEFEEAIRTREAGRDSDAAARAGIEAAFAAGLAAVRKLDVIVSNQLRDDAVAMAVWERDRRVDFRRRPKSATPPAAAVTPSVSAVDPGVTP